MKTLNHVSKPVALVTGAGGGLGSSLCEALDRKGYALVLTGRNMDSLKKTAARLCTAPVILPADLTVSSQVKMLCEALTTYSVTHLFLNAGVGTVGAFAENNGWRACLDVNLLSPMALAKAFLLSPHAASMVCISSVAGDGADPYMAVYGATKSFMTDFCLALAYEGKGSPSITTVCPGPLATPFDRRAGCTISRRGHSPEKCARRCIRAMEKQKKLVYPFFSDFLCHTAFKFLPVRCMVPITRLLQRQKMK